MSHRLSIVAALTLCLASVVPQLCLADFTFLGPTPYFSKADSPFPVDSSNPNFFIEDFEPAPGCVPGELSFCGGGKFSPKGARLAYGGAKRGFSLGIDDQVDGSGQNGASGGRTPLILIGNEALVSFFRIEFDAQALGFLPNAVGFAVTDGASEYSGFSTYDMAGNRKDYAMPYAQIGSIAPGSGKFIGVFDTDGIEKIEIGQRLSFADATDPLRIDHFQYGFIPEPSTVAIASFLLIFSVKRTRLLVQRQNHY